MRDWKVIERLKFAEIRSFTRFYDLAVSRDQLSMSKIVKFMKFMALIFFRILRVRVI